MRPASTQTTSTAPTASSSDATTPAKARRSPKPGALITDYTIAYNEGDFDKLFGDLTTPGMQFENRSRSVFPDRSVDEFRASVEELSSMVSSVANMEFSHLLDVDELLRQSP